MDTIYGAIAMISTLLAKRWVDQNQTTNISRLKTRQDDEIKDPALR